MKRRHTQSDPHLDAIARSIEGPTLDGVPIFDPYKRPVVEFEEHWSSPNGCHEDCPACAVEANEPSRTGD